MIVKALIGEAFTTRAHATTAASGHVPLFQIYGLDGDLIGDSLDVAETSRALRLLQIGYAYGLSAMALKTDTAVITASQESSVTTANSDQEGQHGR